MMKQILCAVFLFSSCATYALDQISGEQRYYSYLNAIENGATKNLVVLDSQDANLMVDALWTAQEEGMVPMRMRQSLRELSQDSLNLSDRLRLAVLRHRVRMNFKRRELGTAVVMGLASATEGRLLALQIISLREDLAKMGLNHLVVAAKLIRPIDTQMSLAAEDQTIVDQTQLAADLWNHTPDLTQWNNGRYSTGIRLYMFCRAKRQYPCLQVVRDIHHEPVRNADGTLWAHPALAKSRGDLPSNRVNGHTPTGVHTIDGVMPYADQIPSFGKHRRLILDFVPRSTNEQRHRDLLPESSQASNWWRPNVVARDMGRKYFRIHGSGRASEEVTAPWHPFRPTSGCVAKRENTYDGVEYNDQQELLNALMAAMDLEPKYENETAIKGLMFFIELDSKDAPVTMADLNAIGIQ